MYAVAVFITWWPLVKWLLGVWVVFAVGFILGFTAKRWEEL